MNALVNGRRCPLLKVSLFFHAENSKKYRAFALFVMVIYLTYSTFSAQALAAQYTFVEDDTLWSISKVYLNSPYEWPRIKNLDGSPIQDIYRIPIGHTVFIPDQIIKPEKLSKIELEPTISAINISKKHATTILTQGDINNPSVIDLNNHQASLLIQNPYHYLILTKKTGFVRAFIDAQHVYISIPLLIEKLKTASPEIELKIIGNGVAISTDLINEILGLKK